LIIVLLLFQYAAHRSENPDLTMHIDNFILPQKKEIVKPFPFYIFR